MARGTRTASGFFDNEFTVFTTDQELIRGRDAARRSAGAGRRWHQKNPHPDRRRRVAHCGPRHSSVPDPGRDLHQQGGQEMADRIRTMLAGQVAPSWGGTFHGLGARQLRVEPDVAALRPGFDILDAEDSQRLIKRDECRIR
jgi:hypothetical protein